jgi:hypothetical protein
MAVCSQSNILHWQKQKHQIHWIKYFIIWVSKFNVCIQYIRLTTYCHILVKQLMTDFCLFQSHLLSQSGNNTVLLMLFLIMTGLLWKYDDWSFRFHHFLENGWFYRENTYKCSPLVTKWQIILHFHCCFNNKYSQTYFKRLPLGQRKKWSFKRGDLLKEDEFIWNFV